MASIEYTRSSLLDSIASCGCEAAAAVTVEKIMPLLQVVIIALVILNVTGKIEASPYLDVYPNVSQTASTNDTLPLYFGLMLSLSGDQQSTGALAGVQAALDNINSRDDLLPGYSLHYTLTDSKCDKAAALDGLFTQLFEPPEGKVALIGSGCSIATEATSEISHYYSIAHVSCTSSLNMDKIPTNYYQLLPSGVKLARVIHQVIAEYKWKRVALIVQTNSWFKANVRSLSDMLTKSMVEHSQLLIDGEDINTGQSVFDSTAYRIYVLATSSKLARQLLCEAYHLGLKYPKYVFITYATGVYGSQWWRAQNSRDKLLHGNGCSSENIEEVLQFSLAVSNFHATSRNEIYYDLCHDATFALAYSLHAATQLETSPYYYRANSVMWNEKFLNNDTTSCEHEVVHFRRCGNSTHSLLSNHLKNVSFIGATGPVHFDKNGFRLESDLRILQYRATYINGNNISIDGNLSDILSLVTVAYSVGDSDNNSLEFVDGGKSSIWPSYIPYDGVPRTELVTVSLSVTIVFVILNITGILYALLCLFFNIIFYKKRVVRLDSPNLNYLIILGSLMEYTSCIFFVLPSLNPSAVASLCFMRGFLASVGYTLIFGTVIVKLWRIYSIFSNPTVAKNKMGIKDCQLILTVICLTIVDIFFWIVYIIVEAVLTHFNVGTEPNTERPGSTDGELGVETLYITFTCSTNLWIRQIAIAVVYLYKFFLYVCALYFVYRLSKVKLTIKGINNAKYIVAFIYVSSITLALTFISTLTLSKHINVYAAIYSLGFWIITSSILGFLFTPKMVGFYKDPNGTKMFSTHEDSEQGIHKVKALDTSTT